MIHHAAVIVVPPNLDKLVAVVVKDWVRALRWQRIDEACLTRCMRGHAYSRKYVINLRVQFFEDRSDVEAIDEESCTPSSICMRKKMEELQTARVSLESIKSPDT